MKRELLEYANSGADTFHSSALVSFNISSVYAFADTCASAAKDLRIRRTRSDLSIPIVEATEC